MMSFIQQFYQDCLVKFALMMSAPRDLRDRQDLQVRLGLKATSVFQAHGAFRGRPEQLVPPDQWGRKASRDRRAFKA